MKISIEYYQVYSDDYGTYDYLVKSYEEEVEGDINDYLDSDEFHCKYELKKNIDWDFAKVLDENDIELKNFVYKYSEKEICCYDE